MAYQEYLVQTWRGGKPVNHEKIQAISYLDAAKSASKSANWKHVIVAGKMQKRYNRKYEQISVPCKMYPVFYSNKAPAILCMYDNRAEVYEFPNHEARNTFLEEHKNCTTFPFAEYVKAKQAQTVTTASSEETSGSKNILTSKKTSKESVMSVTWQGWQTLGNTGKSSGIAKSKGTATSTWYNGSKAYHSVPDQTLFATVKTSDNTNMIGKTVKVERAKSKKTMFFDLLNGYIWEKSQLDFRHFSVQPSRAIPDKAFVMVKGSQIVYKKKLQGDVKGPGHYCSCGCGLIIVSGQIGYFHHTWLIPYNREEKRIGQIVETSREKNSIASRREASTDNRQDERRDSRRGSFPF